MTTKPTDDEPRDEREAQDDDDEVGVADPDAPGAWVLDPEGDAPEPNEPA